MKPDRKTVLIVSPQASRIGHGALHGQRTLAAFAEFEEWNTIFLTGAGFAERVAHQPLFGEIIEADIDFAEAEAYDGPVSAILWGLKRRKLQRKLFQIIDELLEVRLVDAVLALDGDVSVIYECWRRNFQKHPSIAWVTAHSTLDFWFKYISIRSLFKWWVKSKVKRMLLGMGATILFADEKLLNEFFRVMDLPIHAKSRIVLANFGCDPEDLRFPKEDARKFLGIPEEASVALFFGLIRSDKRPELAINVVAEAGYPWWILLAGKPYSYSDSEIRDIVLEANIVDRSLLILKYLDEDEIKYAYSAADLLLMTHSRELLSNSGVLNLARSYRLPVIIKKASHLGRIVEAEGIGIVCSNDNAEAFASALNSYLNLSHQDRNRLVENLEKSANVHSFMMTTRSYITALNKSIDFTQRHNGSAKGFS